MTDIARTAVDERDVLLRMLDDQRRAVHNAVRGLSEQQARSTPSASQLSLAAVIKHLTQGERTWTVVRMAGRDAEVDPQGEWMAGFQVGADETVPVLLAEWAEVAKATEEIVRAEPDLDRVVEISADTRRWLPAGADFTVRWVLLHLLEESARHAGHADIIRESIDGKSAWQLEAEAQGINGPGW
jgi:uncharacterized damage-inducible protein DinB